MKINSFVDFYTSGIDPLSLAIALSASTLWSNLIKPTPFEIPGTEPSLEPPGTEKQIFNVM